MVVKRLKHFRPRNSQIGISRTIYSEKIRIRKYFSVKTFLINDICPSIFSSELFVAEFNVLPVVIETSITILTYCMYILKHPLAFIGIKSLS